MYKRITFIYMGIDKFAFLGFSQVHVDIFVD